MKPLVAGHLSQDTFQSLPYPFPFQSLPYPFPFQPFPTPFPYAVLYPVLSYCTLDYDFSSRSTVSQS